MVVAKESIETEEIMVDKYLIYSFATFILVLHPTYKVTWVKKLNISYMSKEGSVRTILDFFVLMP
jgi:hypothetical protein